MPNPEISYRNVGLLAFAQAMLMTGTSLLVATSALVGLRLAENPALATIPLGLQFLAMTLTAIPASLFMGRYGRRAGFLVGISIGIAGTLLAGYAILQENFALFGFASILIGMFNATGQFYRFAAAEVASVQLRARAIGLVLAGGIAAAFVGPNIASWTRELLAPDFAASYLVLTGMYAMGVIAIAMLQIPRPDIQLRFHEGRPLPGIITQPRFIMAVVSATVGYGVMNLLMVATPMSMDHHHHSFSDAAFVIQWHVVAMFLPSFFTGDLIRRFGLNRIIAIGVLMMIACVGINWTGHSVMHYWTSLLLLGIGWNFMFIGGTTMLTLCYRDEEKAKAQAFNDFVVFGTVTVTALGSAAMLATLGWEWLNLLVVPFLLAVLLGLAWLSRTDARSKVSD